MTSYYCAGADDGTITNCNSLQNHCACANPDIASDPDRAANKRLLGYAARELSCMIMVGDVAERADKAVTSDLDTFHGIEHGEPVHVSAAVKDQSRGIASRTGRQQHDVII
jgi:hypothetical protein